MPDKCNNQGRAFEYVCLCTLEQTIKEYRHAEIIKNNSFEASKKAWKKTSAEIKSLLTLGAKAAVDILFELEPLILEEGEDCIDLQIQPDSKGKESDVRDILISRSQICWEIGLSLKHNHFAVKHSRLAKSLDFGEKWFSHPCSTDYWSEIKPVFDFLEIEKNKRSLWSGLINKGRDVYRPLLQAFMNEIKRANEEDNEIPYKMAKYLLGEFDFYKVISVDSKRLTNISAFNINGTLNRSSKTKKSKYTVPLTELPTRIIKIDFKPLSDNTLELFMDNGWQFSLRLHNASSKIETSLKFDVQAIGVPSSILFINAQWI